MKETPNRQETAGMEELRAEYLFLDNPVRENDAKGITQVHFAYCGFEECRPGHSYGPYARTNYVIHVVLSGNGMLLINRKRYAVGEGQMFVLMPGQTTLYQADLKDPWYYCWVAFHGAAAERIIKEIGFSQDRPVLSISEPQAFASIVKKMLHQRRRTALDTLQRQACLLELLAMLIENAEKTGLERGNSTDTELSYADYAISYIQKNFHKRIRVSEIADLIGISRGYLTRLIKEATGMPPQEYLITLRLEHAARFLRHSTDPVREIAMSSGYSDSLAFSKAFKLKYGMSPREYHERYYTASVKQGQVIPEQENMDIMHNSGSDESSP